MSDFQWGYYGATLAYDLLEGLVTGRRPKRVGRAQLAALEAPIRLHQHPRYRAYWLDPERNAMVGVLVGLDLHRQAGRYYVLECNLTAGLMRERRALYADEIDPFITRIAEMAKVRGFRRIIFHRRSWLTDHLKEFAEASARFNMKIEAASAMRRAGDPLVNPMSGLPRDLAPETLYVVCTAVSDSPIFQFLHHKAQVDRWLAEAIAPEGATVRRLAAVPSSREIFLPPTSDDPRWPNLVVKLATSDEGRDVLMGRFTSEAAARRALGMPEQGPGLPAFFLRGFQRRVIAALAPDALAAVFQAFIPPEIVGGRPRNLRMEMFLSPLEDLFLSAHATVGGTPLPKTVPLDVALPRSPFNVSVPPGRFVRLDEPLEAELQEFAREFGAAARRAITAKFSTSPE